MGQVFLGATPGGRKVAVKVIRPEYADDSGFRVRFAREIEAARRVGGFHTALVIDADPDSDPPWMATSYIPGPSLAIAVAERGPLGPAAVSELGAVLAEGLAAIHACGLIHRDLKPGNIIMAADGPRIIDFGIARNAGATTITASGVSIGTMQYMSPEHLGAGEIGPQSDVFSLGALLTFAATGKAPFDADLQSAVIGRILTQPPDLGDLGGPLRDIISACLAKNPADRPGPDGLLAHFAAPATAPAAPSVSSRDKPTASGEEAPHTSTVTLGPSPSERRAAGADPGQELHPGVDGSRRGSGPDSLIATLTRPAADGRSRAFRALAFSPHGAILAASSDGNFVQLWRTLDWTPLRTFADDEDILRSDVMHGLAFGQDGRRVATGGLRGEIVLWDAPMGRQLRVFKGHGYDLVQSVALSHDGELLAAVGRGFSLSVTVWQARGRLRPRVLAAAKIPDSSKEPEKIWSSHSVTFSPDDRLLASSWGNDVRLWDTRRWTKTWDCRGHTDAVLAVAFSSKDANWLASGGRDATVRLWMPTGARAAVRTLTGHAGHVLTIAFSPDARQIASGGIDGTVRLWDTATGTPLRTLAGHTGHVHSVAFSPDGRQIASASSDGTVRVWDAYQPYAEHT
jgi:serine/threonine protein kinase